VDALFPEPLFALMRDRYDSTSYQMLTEQAGGVWNDVNSAGSGSAQLHSMLKHLAADGSRLQRLVANMSQSGYMNDIVARAVDAFIEQQVARGQVDDLVAAISGHDGRWEAFRIRWGSDLDDDGRSRIRNYGDDRAATCRSALLVYALAGKLELLRTVFGVPASTVVEARGRLQVANPSTAASPSALRPFLAGQRSASDAGGAARLRQRAQSGPNGPSAGGAPRGARDARDTQALRDLVYILDEALSDVARRDANGAVPEVDEDAALLDYGDVVGSLRTEISDELDNGDPDVDLVLALLGSLVATAAAGVDLAERERDHLTVAQLASDAARSCQEVARSTEGDAVSDLLTRAAALWEMKSSHARHRSDREHRDQLHATGQRTAPPSAVRAATRSARAGAQR